MTWKQSLSEKIRPQIGRKNESTRVAWVQDTLKNVPDGFRILDAGAGERPFKPFCSHLTYVSQDFAKYDGLGDEAGLHTGRWNQSDLDIKSDITCIPEQDMSFDAVMCTEVFEHIPDPVAAIKEFSRLLKDGGQLIITAPFWSLTHFAPYHYATGFNSYFYEKHLPDAGFEIVELERNGDFFECVAQEIGRVRSVSKKYGAGSIGLFQRLALAAALRVLENKSKKATGSEELLCFGIHVLARRRSR